MNETDAMTLLAKANPVRVDDLARMDFPDLSPARLPGRRLVLALAVSVVALAASLIGVSALAGQGPHHVDGGHLDGPGAVGATGQKAALSIPLSEALSTLGAPVVLPDTPLVGPSDAAPEASTVDCPEGSATPSPCLVQVKFPAKSIAIDYFRPQPYDDPGAAYKACGTNMLDLNGVPGCWIEYPGVESMVEFVLGGTRILVVTSSTDYDETALQAIAQSIVDRTRRSSVEPPGLNLLPITPPRKPVSLRKASRRLGVFIPLPGLRLLKRSTAGEGWQEGTCPPSGRRGCMIWIPFPSESVAIVYQRPRPSWPRTPRQYEVLATKVKRSRVVDLNGVPAWLVPQHVDHHNPGFIHSPGFIDFAVGGTRVRVAGSRDSAFLEAIARSIVERSRAR